MTIIRPPSYGYGSYSSSSSHLPVWVGPTFWLVAVIGLIAWGSISVIGFMAGLLSAAGAGLAIGWLRQAISRRSRFGESLISALFGAGLSREPPRLVVFDLFLHAAVGYVVGVLFLQIGIVPTSSPSIMANMMVGGPGGGPDWGAVAGSMALWVVVAVIVGMIVALVIGAWAGAALNGYLCNPHGLAKAAVEGATREMVQEASYGQERRWEIRPGRSAAKGAVTGALVGLFLLMAEAIPFLSK